MGRAITIRGFQFIANLTLIGQRQALFGDGRSGIPRRAASAFLMAARVERAGHAGMRSQVVFTTVLYQRKLQIRETLKETDDRYGRILPSLLPARQP